MAHRLILVLAHEVAQQESHADGLVQEAADAVAACKVDGSLSQITLVVVGSRKVKGQGIARLDSHARDWTAAAQHHDVLWSSGELMFGRIVKCIGLDEFQPSSEQFALQASLLNLLRPTLREIASGVRSVLTRMCGPPISKVVVVSPCLDAGLDGRLHAADAQTISVLLPALQAEWRDFDMLRGALITAQSPL